jgi:hypothetical protein
MVIKAYSSLQDMAQNLRKRHTKKNEISAQKETSDTVVGLPLSPTFCIEITGWYYSIQRDRDQILRIVVKRNQCKIFRKKP